MKMKTSIDIGLAALVKHAKHGQILTCKEISDVCECTPQRISEIETAAMNKLKRKRLMRDLYSGQ